MEDLRALLEQFRSCVTSSRPSEIEKLLRQIASSVACLLKVEQTSQGQACHSQQGSDASCQGWKEEAIELLLDAFCDAHAADHMSDHLSLGSWRLPYVAMLHSFTCLHLPLWRRLQVFSHSIGPSLTPVQCAALATLMLFMTTSQVLRENHFREDKGNYNSVVGDEKSMELDQTSALQSGDNRGDNHFEMKLSTECEERHSGMYLKPCLEWTWEACYKGQYSYLDKAPWENTTTGKPLKAEELTQGNRADVDYKESSRENSSVTSPAKGYHWISKFWERMPLGSEANLLWTARFAASYFRHASIYWEQWLLVNESGKSWLPDLMPQPQTANLVGPFFVAYVPKSLIHLLMWLWHRLTLAHHIEPTSNIGISDSGRKALALCNAVISSPLCSLLLAKTPLSLRNVILLELQTGSSDLISIKSRHLFFRNVIWGGMTFGNETEKCFKDAGWGLLWKEFSGDRNRACVALTHALLSSHDVCSRVDLVEEQPLGRLVEEEKPEGSSHDCANPKTFTCEDRNIPCSGSKRHFFNVAISESHNIVPKRGRVYEVIQPHIGCEHSEVKDSVLQLLMELSSSSWNAGNEPWFLQVAVDCLESHEQSKRAKAVHRLECTSEHQCINMSMHDGIILARGFKACISSLPVPHFLSGHRWYQMWQVLKHCWLADGPFCLHFAGQLLPVLEFYVQNLRLVVESEWSAMLMSSWVRFWNYVGPRVTALVHTAATSWGQEFLTSIRHLRSMHEFLISQDRDWPNGVLDGYKEAAKKMPRLAAVVLVESLLTSTPLCSGSLQRTYFLHAIAGSKSSQQSHKVLHKLVGVLEQIAAAPHSDKQDSSSSGPGFELFDMLLELVAGLLVQAVLTWPQAFARKWIRSDYKRRWVLDYPLWLETKELGSSSRRKIIGVRNLTSTGSDKRMFSKADRLLTGQKATTESGAAHREREDLQKSVPIPLASLEVEFNERMDRLKTSTMWVLLLDLAISLVSLCPSLIGRLGVYLEACTRTTEQKVTGALRIMQGEDQLLHPIVICLVIAGLPKEMVISVARSKESGADLISLLQRIEGKLELAFYCLLAHSLDPWETDDNSLAAQEQKCESLSGSGKTNFDPSKLCKEMGNFLLQLQGISQQLCSDTDLRYVSTV